MRSAAALKQGDRFASELGRELPSRFRHPTPSPFLQSVSEVSVEPVLPHFDIGGEFGVAQSGRE